MSYLKKVIDYFWPPSLAEMQQKEIFECIETYATNGRLF